ncbi:MAG: peptide-methionine (S)-S-oxide reductase MsrA [Vicinamibacterales bacterium]
MNLSKLFGAHGEELKAFPDPARDVDPARSQATTAVLAGGCFWCTEAVFLPLAGVTGVTSGYIGGSAATANYHAVCSGTTGHAEAIEIRFDPAVISYGQLLKVFFAVAHDPTQLNRQGGDRGTQYRSAIFPADDEQRVVAAAFIAQLTDAEAFADPIVTTIEPLGTFYPAEGYHQNYAALNPAQPYVAAVALPKVAKLESAFPEKLKGR